MVFVRLHACQRTLEVLHIVLMALPSLGPMVKFSFTDFDGSLRIRAASQLPSKR